MGILDEELGIDLIGFVHIEQADWHQGALSMIEARRQQLSAAATRVKTEAQQEAVTKELKRMSDLEFYVRTMRSLAGGLE